MPPRNRPRSKALIGLLLGSVVLAGGIAVAQKAPESLLPPGFGEPAAPSPESAPAAPQASQPTDLLPPAELNAPDQTTADTTSVDQALDNATAAVDETPPADREMPPQAKRSLAIVGPLDPGLGADAFGGVSGRFLSTLLHRIDAPIASRWGSITLRTALLTRVPTPRDVAPVDWVAERAWLLLRMGEADAARMLVQSVDVENFDPRMFAVATQVALATADPPALCPMAVPAQSFSQEPVWPLASAMCAGLSGEAGVSSAQIDRIRQTHIASGIDLLLAEKVVGTGVNGRRAINIEWDGVDRLNAWRFGMATALGVPIPEPLFATVGPHVQAWRARAPMLSPAQRVGPARTAAALGVFSNAALVDLYGAVADGSDPSELSDSDAGRLRTAYVGEDDDARMTALRALWSAPKDERDRYAAAILTARAAARIRPNDSYASDSAALIGAMMAAGLDMQAERWSGVVAKMDASAGDNAWAMLAVGAPRPAVDLSYGRVDAFRDRAGEAGLQKARLLIAALAGLGRLSPSDQARLASNAGLALGYQDRWTRTMDYAVAAHEPGTVAVLTAAAMQTPSWGGVPPIYFYHMIAAMRQVGLEPQARMMAAEAMSRL
jgi:hypothetical protein